MYSDVFRKCNSVEPEQSHILEKRKAFLKIGDPDMFIVAPPSDANMVVALAPSKSIVPVEPHKAVAEVSKIGNL